MLKDVTWIRQIASPTLPNSFVFYNLLTTKPSLHLECGALRISRDKLRRTIVSLSQPPALRKPTSQLRYLCAELSRAGGPSLTW